MGVGRRPILPWDVRRGVKPKSVYLAYDGLPVPPRRLAWRVGCPRWARRPDHFYVIRGLDISRAIRDALPPDWSFEGTRVLDFGCGAGRVLRHFRAEAASAEFWGCDIHEPSVDWMQQALCPPLHAFRNRHVPPLDQPDGSFDLIWAVSVFPHITDQWSAWLLELHRVLVDSGLLLVTFMGEGVPDGRNAEPWLDDRVGMNMINPGQGWDRGGPFVHHSPWWIRAHWGRAFEVVELRPYGFGRLGRNGQGSVLLRKRPVTLTTEDLERPEPDEPRELMAAQYNVRRSQAELAAIYAGAGWKVARTVKELATYPRHLTKRLVSPAESVPVPHRTADEDGNEAAATGLSS